MEIQITVIDDHRIVRDGLKALLLGNRNIKLVGSFGDPISFLKWLEENSCPDVTLMDITMPQMSGIELTRKVLQSNPKSKIIVLTANTARHFLEASLKAGAKGFLSKDCEKEELISAIEQVFSGHYYIDRSLNQDMVRNYISALEYSTPDRDLTEREVDIVRGFANGLSYQDIAEELNISKKTVETHKRSIFDKLNISNNAELVKYAIRNKIVEL
ncbi:response regulator transcription factor [Marivirga sp. S37H4]|uniref:Response regulator transcription factor n=1 Tax=Marivirga aurantiaca TaxID=2802615 RepID=A0A934WYX2_9BACT|nr:response regulator transcription factor [Marivirga aurantiaca]MBK6265417.1 response regulator transcription factor [Marivirga aurantiaca]